MDMSMGSVAIASVSTYQPLHAGRHVAVGSNAPALPVTPDSETQAVRPDVEHLRGGRENTLVRAMMTALQSLGIGPAATETSSPATATDPVATVTPVTVADTATTPKDIEKAVHEFAHEMFQALREGRGLEHTHGNHDHRDNGEHNGENRGELAHRGAMGYGNLAQRMEQLAQTLGAPAPDAAAAPDASPAPASGGGGLLAAFSKLMTVLQPGSAGAPVAPAPPASTTDPLVVPPDGVPGDMLGKLKLFLQALAQTLHPAAASELPAATGSLLNVTA
jgi:hypothetical protein